MRRFGTSMVFFIALLIVGIISVPIILALLISEMEAGFFFSIICALLMISGGWQLVRGKTWRGFFLLMMSGVVFAVVLY